MHSLTSFIIITIFSYGFCETNNLEKPNIILILADDIVSNYNQLKFIHLLIKQIR